MARQFDVNGNHGDARRSEAIIRICRRVTEIDPDYARAWALLANAEGHLRLYHGRTNDGGMAAAERAIALDPTLAEAHAARAQILGREGHVDEALAGIAIARRLDPESYDVNAAAGRVFLAARRYQEAIACYGKAESAAQNDYGMSGMLISCYKAIGDAAGAHRAAQRCLASAERIVAERPDNGSAMSFGVGALATLGEFERAREWMARALLVDPDNHNMRYNFACMHVVDLHDHDGALTLLGPLFEVVSIDAVNWAKVDPDLDPLRDDPRFQAMVANAEARLGASV
jgi:adenylate cyclase